MISGQDKQEKFLVNVWLSPNKDLASVRAVSRPILVSRQRLKKFLEQYRLGRLISYRRFTKGFANIVLRLQTSQGIFILKIIGRNNPERVRYEVDLLNFIKGLPTPRPVKATNGQYIVQYNKTYKAFLYKYLPGQQRSVFNNQMLGQVGEFLGKLHQQTKLYRPNVNRIELYNLSQQSLPRVIRICRRVRDKQVRKWIDYIEQEIPKYFLPKSLPQGGMHIDVKPENTFFNKNRLTGVVDFDNSYNGPLLLDLANTMMWFCSKRGQLDTKKTLTIFRGYQRARKNSGQEKKFLFEAIHFVTLSHILVDFYFFALKALPISYIRWSIGNLLKAEKNLKLSKGAFTLMYK